jgi:hypothetical protein
VANLFLQFGNEINYNDFKIKKQNAAHLRKLIIGAAIKVLFNSRLRSTII